MNSPQEFLTGRYNQLWDGAIELVRDGAVNRDPLLASREPDRRRCLTLIARPSTEVQGAVTTFLDQLRGIDPEQYYYTTPELHVTVLSMFTATQEHERFFTRYADYLAAIQAVVKRMPVFGMEFTGVTLTTEAVMIQGFPDTKLLNDTRELLRQELRDRGLTEGLDGRYVLQTAHMTVVRFREPLKASRSYAEVLEACRGQEFGRTEATELHLVKNDWYMSSESVEVLQRFKLA